jgi:hypothetical protein
MIPCILSSQWSHDNQLLYDLQGIDPHLLLLIFLPTIGFSAGIAQEPHLLRRNWGQVQLG